MACLTGTDTGESSETVFPDTHELRQMNAADVYVPKHLGDARTCPLSHKWLAATAAEMANMQHMGVMVQVERRDVPPGVVPLPMKMVYACKALADGKIEKFKARWVAVGYFQKKGRDYDKTYAPVTNLMSVKTLLSIANRLDLTIFSTDVKAAFLQSELEETIYVRFDGKVYRLYKTLYGLKQSAYMWNADLDKELRGNHDMTQSRGDPCFYFRKNDDGLLLVVTWVDDLICASTTNSIRDEFIKGFKYEFGSTQLEIQWVLKISIERAGELLSLSQKAYIDAKAKLFGVTGSNPQYTPMIADAKHYHKGQCPEVGSDEYNEMAGVPYRELLGALLYAAELRGDIAFAVNKLARFASNPGRVHWKALKRVLIYLYTTHDRRLVFGRTPDDDLDIDNPIAVYLDADHAGDRDTSRSTSGIIITVFGDVVYHKSKMQGKVANSTGAAELHAMAKALRIITPFRVIIEDIGFYQKTIPFYSDSQVAIDMIARGYLSSATKHLLISFHSVLEAKQAGDIDLNHVPGVKNPSDLLTKSLPRDGGHDKHTDFILADRGLEHLWTPS